MHHIRGDWRVYLRFSAFRLTSEDSTWNAVHFLRQPGVLPNDEQNVVWMDYQKQAVLDLPVYGTAGYIIQRPGLGFVYIGYIKIFCTVCAILTCLTGTTQFPHFFEEVHIVLDF